MKLVASEADARYLDRIGDDCATLLGPGAEILDVQLSSRPTSVALRVRYSVGGSIHVTAADGETVIEAHAALRRQLAADRLAQGFVALVHGR